MPLFRALSKNMAASFFGKKAPYGFVMEVTLLYGLYSVPLLTKQTSHGHLYHDHGSKLNFSLSETLLIKRPVESNYSKHNTISRRTLSVVTVL